MSSVECPAPINFTPEKPVPKARDAGPPMVANQFWLPPVLSLAMTKRPVFAIHGFQTGMKGLRMWSIDSGYREVAGRVGMFVVVAVATGGIRNPSAVAYRVAGFDGICVVTAIAQLIHLEISDFKAIYPIEVTFFLEKDRVYPRSDFDRFRSKPVRRPRCYRS